MELEKTPKTNEKFDKLILLTCNLYNLNLPNAILKGITLDFLQSNRYSYEQMEEAIKMNLSGKFGQIVKIYGLEISALFFSEVLIEYQKYLDVVVAEGLKNREIERMENEKLKAENQNAIDRENFKNDTIAQFKAKTLIPKFYHWKILIDEGLIIEDKERLQTCFEMEYAKVENMDSKAMADFMGLIIPKEENIMNRAKEYYIKIELTK